VLEGVSEAQLVGVEVEEEVGEKEGETLPLGDPDCEMPPVGVLMFTVEEVDGLEVGVNEEDPVEDEDTLLPLVLTVEVKVAHEYVMAALYKLEEEVEEGETNE
jgi:hypothetical protein